MKSLKAIGLGIIAGGLAFGFCEQVNAQNFREEQGQWKSETIKARRIDTVRIERHSFFELPSINDTTPLVYHEPMPDSLMPKAAIEIGQITIQSGTADGVVEALEKQARNYGADWIVGFNEPRMKINKEGDVYYRSQAMLYKVINPELVPEDQVIEISCGENHLQNCAAIIGFVKHRVAKSGE
jgi:hypothetical protein